LRNICPAGGTIILAVTNPITLVTADNNVYGPSAFAIQSTSEGNVHILIEGNGATIQRGTDVAALRFFLIQPSGTLAMKNLTLRDGIAAQAGSLGGAILNYGGLSLENATLTGNQVFGGGGRSSGGAIFNGGQASILASTLSSNSCSGGSSALGDGTDGIGGGIYNEGFLGITNSTLSGNTAQGGNSDAFTGGSASGGGIHNNGTLWLAGSTLADNTVAVGAGGIPPVADGGALYNSGVANLINTIMAYSGDAIDAVNDGTANGHHNLAGSYSGFGNIFIGNSPDPKLGPLQCNGGTTLTHALLAGSPAIDAGSSGLKTDQRGVGRGVVDIGAFEAHPWLSVIPPTAMDEDTQATVRFTLGDRLLLAANPITNITATCSDSNLVPATGLVIARSVTNGTLRISPATNANGRATITVTAGTTNGSMSVSFDLTVNPVNDQPTLAPIADLAIIDNSGSQIVNLSGITSGPTNESQTLAVTAISSNPALIPGVQVNYLSPATNGTLTFTTLPDACGEATITVTVNDGAAVNNLVTQTFLVQVNARPRVAITLPANNAVFVVPQDIGIVADATDACNGTITNRVIYQGTTQLGVTDAGGLFTWSGAVPGSYNLKAVATDNLGVSGTSTVVRVTVLARPQISYTSAVDMTSPRVIQTGLFYQTVCVSNSTPETFDAVRVSITNLPTFVAVWNAMGTNNGMPYVQHNHPIPPQSSVCLEIEYYARARWSMPNPTFITELMDTDPAPDPQGRIIAIHSQRKLQDGTFLFWITNTVAGRTYYVQYSASGGAPWKTALPAIIGNGTHTSWIDTGPPKTESHPSSVAARFYRIVQP
jgi:hypothetical protein